MSGQGGLGARWARKHDQNSAKKGGILKTMAAFWATSDLPNEPRPFLLIEDLVYSKHISHHPYAQPKHPTLGY
jgi:hypothetical protein